MPDFHNYWWVLRDWLILAGVLALPMLGLGVFVWRQRQGFLPPVRWSAVPWTGPQVLAAFLLTQIVTLLLLDFCRRGVWLRWLYGDVPWPADIVTIRAALWATTLSLPLQLLGVLLLLRHFSEARPQQLGWTARRFGANVCLGFLHWLVLMPTILLLNMLVLRVQEILTHHEPEPHVIQKLMAQAPLPPDWVLVVLTALVAAPLLEELLYRGVLLGWAARQGWRSDIIMAVALVIAFLSRDTGLATALAGLRQGEDAAGSLLFELQPAFFVLGMLPFYLALRFGLRIGKSAAPAELPGSVGVSPTPCEQIQPAAAITGSRPALPTSSSAPDEMPVPPDRSVAACGIFSSALLFAIWHSTAWPSPIPLLPLGLVLGWLAWRTQSLVAPVVLHSLFNAVAVLGLLHLPDKPPEPVKGSSATSTALRPPSTSAASSVPAVSCPRRM